VRACTAPLPAPWGSWWGPAAARQACLCPSPLPPAETHWARACVWRNAGRSERGF
jgi:hypothetical protein